MRALYEFLGLWCSMFHGSKWKGLRGFIKGIIKTIGIFVYNTWPSVPAAVVALQR